MSPSPSGLQGSDEGDRAGAMAGGEEDLGTPGPSRREQEGGRQGKGGMRGAGRSEGRARWPLQGRQS